MGKIVNLMAEEEDAEEYRADTDTIRERAWTRYFDLLDDTEELGISFNHWLIELKLCDLSNRL